MAGPRCAEVSTGHRRAPALACSSGFALPPPTHPFSSALSFSTSMVSSSSLSEELYSGWARFMVAVRGLRGKVGAAGGEELAAAAAPLRAQSSRSAHTDPAHALPRVKTLPSLSHAAPLSRSQRRAWGAWGRRARGRRGGAVAPGQQPPLGQSGFSLRDWQPLWGGSRARLRPRANTAPALRACPRPAAVRRLRGAPPGLH